MCVIDYALVCLGVEGLGQLLEDRHEGVKVFGVWCSIKYQTQASTLFVIILFFFFK